LESGGEYGSGALEDLAPNGARRSQWAFVDVFHRNWRGAERRSNLAIGSHRQEQ
jgi:hypothetical protein